MHAALELIAKSSTQTNLPSFKVGQTVRIHQRIKEGDKQRVQVFEGIIIKTGQGTGINGTITVRKVVDGVGVERVFPIHSPLIAKVEITKEAKVRRSKLYFLRERSGKSARMKTTVLEGQVFQPTRYKEEVPAEEVVAEMPAAEAEPPAEAPAQEAPVAAEAAPEAPAVEQAPVEAVAEEAAPAEQK